MKCKDIANKYDVTPMQVGRLRKRFFPDGGGDLTEEEVATLTEYYESLDDLEERQAMEEAVKPKFVDAMVTFVKEGQRRVEVHLRDSKERAIALIPYAARRDMLLRPIKLEEIEYDGTKYYRDATLAGRAWKGR